VHFDEFSSSWNYLVLGRWSKAIERIGRLTEEVRARASLSVLSRARDAGELGRDDPMSLALAYWREKSGKADNVSMGLHEMLEQRYTTFTTPKNSHDFLITNVGSGLPGFAREWLSKARGMRVQDQPDHLYGRSCAQSYREVLSRREPKFEDVDAIAHWPGYGPLRRRYHRLLLPFCDAMGNGWILSATRPDQAIQLRSDARL
jgi:hypothetical protein